MYAFTITTKDKCRHCINEFDSQLIKYLKSKGVDLSVAWYKLEESKFTKWHAHGYYTTKWERSDDDLFYVFFKKMDDRDAWVTYCTKSLLDVNTPFFLTEDDFEIEDELEKEREIDGLPLVALIIPEGVEGVPGVKHPEHPPDNIVSILPDGSQ